MTVYAPDGRLDWENSLLSGGKMDMDRFAGTGANANHPYPIGATRRLRDSNKELSGLLTLAGDRERIWLFGFPNEETGSMPRMVRARMTTEKHIKTKPFFSRRQVLKWTGALALAGHIVLESRLAQAFRSANAPPKHGGPRKGSDLLVDLEHQTSITLPPFDDASGTVHVVGEGRKTAISWRSS